MLYGLLARSAVSFNPATDIPDLSGKVILITGGNVGLGLESALQLSSHKPSKIYLACRSETKAVAAIETIRAQVPSAKLEYLPLDLTSFPSIVACTKAFLAKEKRLDVLILNAGVMATPPATTEQGYEIQFGTNHMGHALLTNGLLPTMLRTANLLDSDVRVVSVSSVGHLYAPRHGIDFEHLASDMKAWDTLQRYAQSKLANILFTKELARRYPSITAIAVHPGLVNTELYRTIFSGWFGLGRIANWGKSWVCTGVKDGAKGQLWCATGKGVVNGEFYMPLGIAGQGSGWTTDKVLAEKLWDWTEAEIKAWEL